MAEDRGLYVSSKAGHHVTRYGTGTLIGAEIDLSHPGNIRWNEQSIVAIPEAEYLAYKAEYDAVIAVGALAKRSAGDYQAFLAARDAKIEADAAKTKAAAEPLPEPKPVESKKFTGRKPEES